MARAWIWAPVIGDGTHKNPWRADVPDGVPWGFDDSIPLDRLMGPRPEPLVRYAHIDVDEKDVDKVTSRVDEKDVPEKDRLAIAMVRAHRGKWETAHEFFRAIPGLDTAAPERKADVDAILLQAVARGMPVEAAQAVRNDFNLAERSAGAE